MGDQKSEMETKELSVEIVEFYPKLDRCDKERKLFQGTLTIRIPSFGLSIAGFFVTKNENKWLFLPPSNFGKNHVTGRMVRFQILMFDNAEQQTALMKAVEEKGRPFIEDFIEKRLIITTKPQEEKFQPKQSERPKARNHSIEVKETTSKPISQTKSSSSKIWMDLPKRKTPLRGGYRNG